MRKTERVDLIASSLLIVMVFIIVVIIIIFDAYLETNTPITLRSIAHQKIVESPLCSCGAAEDTIDHFLF